MALHWVAVHEATTIADVMLDSGAGVRLEATKMKLPAVSSTIRIPSRGAACYCCSPYMWNFQVSQASGSRWPVPQQMAGSAVVEPCPWGATLPAEAIKRANSYAVCCALMPHVQVFFPPHGWPMKKSVPNAAYALPWFCQYSLKAWYS